MSIVIYPNRALIKPCDLKPELCNIQWLTWGLIRMQELATEHKAHGIAANQCGFNFRAIVVNTAEYKSYLPEVSPSLVIMLNPKIIDKTGTQINKEGCLSFPGVTANIRRAESITIEWEDITFNTHTKDFAWMLAAVCQHEIDHLNGITFYQRAGKTTKQFILKDLKKTKNQAKKALKQQELLKQRVYELNQRNKTLFKIKKELSDKEKKNTES
jgi:peptide deformylase